MYDYHVILDVWSEQVSSDSGASLMEFMANTVICDVLSCQDGLQPIYSEYVATSGEISSCWTEGTSAERISYVFGNLLTFPFDTECVVLEGVADGVSNLVLTILIITFLVSLCCCCYTCRSGSDQDKGESIEMGKRGRK